MNSPAKVFSFRRGAESSRRLPSGHLFDTASISPAECTDLLSSHWTETQHLYRLPL